MASTAFSNSSLVTSLTSSHSSLSSCPHHNSLQSRISFGVARSRPPSIQSNKKKNNFNCRRSFEIQIWGGALGRIRGGGVGFGGNRGENRGGRGSSRGGRGRGRGRDEKVSPEDLDADLEKYHSEAMQTN